MIGIYKYTNQINGKVYIGQSLNVEHRNLAHKSSAFNEKASDYGSRFHEAIRKHGWENFNFEIIAELSPEEYTKELLDELECFFIKYYNSYDFNNGYNATLGGDSVTTEMRQGEKNGRALLTEADVIYIRECYNAHIPFKKVYSEFEDKISKRGFQNVWWFKTWKHILPEYHSEENKYFHSHQAKANASEVAANNKRSFTEEQVKQMRRDFSKGMTPKEIWKKYAPEKAWSTVYNVITYHTYKDIE